MQRSDFALSPAQKMDARTALKALEGTGLTLEEAVRRALAGQRAVERTTAADAVNLFLKSRTGLRPATQAWYVSRLGIFVQQFGDRPMDDVSRADLRQWLAANGIGAGMVRAVRALYTWAIGHEPQLAGQDITAGLSGTAGRSDDIHFLPVKECEALMRGMGKFQAAAALMLFAGIRPGEIANEGKPPLLWRSVNVKERIIRVPSENAKTGRARIMEGLPDTVWRWIGKPGREADPICPARSVQVVRLARELLGYKGKRRWPHDAMRHTFATYHVAAFANPGQTAMLMGHEGNPTMLHRHYRGLATKAEAEAFWALTP